MKFPEKLLENITNVAVLALAVLLFGILFKNYMLEPRSEPRPPAQRSSNSKEALVGTKVSLPDVDWSKNRQTLVLALQKGCHYCSESAAFYRKVVEENGDLHLMAVLPQQVDVGKEYLSSLGVNIEEVRQAPLASLSVQGTPTLLLVNDAGVVTAAWQGKLPPQKEVELLIKLKQLPGS